LSGNAYRGRSKLKALLGEDIFEKLAGKTVVDFGCGYGDQTVELAQQGAGLAIGIDIRQEVLEEAHRKARSLANIEFRNAASFAARDFADFVLSIDAFEHFDHPEHVLRQIHSLLKPNGRLLISFGPPWLHPLGGHAFSVFPWSHKLLSEVALCRWHNAVKDTRLSRFEDVSGGLNRMTVAKFEYLARCSPFREISVTPIPIRRLRRLHGWVTREFTTAVVRAELRK
jgi:SAM-dependent methyltransferase